MLTGLMPPTTGHIFFDGADIPDDLVAHKARVGYVPEEAHVYTYLTGPEYLRLCGRRDGLVLGVLPVRPIVIVVARLGALASYVGLLAVGMNLLTSLSFGVGLAIVLTALVVRLFSLRRRVVVDDRSAFAPGDVLSLN